MTTEKHPSDWHQALQLRKSQLATRRPNFDSTRHIGGPIASQATNNQIAAEHYRRDHAHAFSHRGNNSGKANR